MLYGASMRVLIMTLVLLALSCSKKETSEPEQTGAAEAPSATEDSPQTAEPPAADAPADAPMEMPELPPVLLEGTTPPLDAPPIVSILDRGTEPREALRWELKSGFEEKAKIDVGFTLTALVMTLQLGDPKYIVTFHLTQRVEKVGRDGAFRVSVSVDDATMHPAVLAGGKRAAQFKEALSAVKKSTGGYTMDPSGHVRDVRLDMAEKKAPIRAHDMLDNLRWALVQMKPSFPAEPLGPGAKWTVQRSVLQRGVVVNQFTTYELVKHEGPEVVMKSETRQTADKHRFKSPGKLEEMTLVSLNGIGTGTTTWDLTQLTPRAAEVEGNVVKGVLQELMKEGVKQDVQTAVGTVRTLSIPAN